MIRMSVRGISVQGIVTIVPGGNRVKKMTKQNDMARHGQMRLIDADALDWEHIEEEYYTTIDTVRACKCLVLNAPTIDPVKHGRWLIEPYVGKHATLKVLRCSECDNQVTELPDGKNYNYCPNCGARMLIGDEEVD